MWQVLGLAHRQLDDLAPAVEALTKAAALAPERRAHRPQPWRARRMEAGLPAIDLFERALRARAQRRLGPARPRRGAVRGGRIEAAIAGLEDAARASIRAGCQGHATVARLRWLRGERDGLTASFERALAAAPREIALWRELIDTLMHAARYDEALAAVARGRAAAAGEPGLRRARGGRVAEQGETEAADALFAALGADRARHHGGALHAPPAARRPPGRGVGLRRPLARPRPATICSSPYQSAAWRLTGDPRWQWLEGDDRLIGVYDLGDELPSLDALAERLRGLHLVAAPAARTIAARRHPDRRAAVRRIEPEIRALRRADRRDGRAPHRPAAAAASPAIRPCSPRRAPIRFSGSWSVRLTGGRLPRQPCPSGRLDQLGLLRRACPRPMGGGAEPAG